MKLIFIFALSWMCINAQHNHDSNSVEGKIVGGRRVDIKRFPHQAAIISYGMVICGGSLITEDWVLTAAHCLLEMRADNLRIRLGSNDFTRGGQLVSVSRVSLHPQYSPSTHDFDIGLLHLSSPATAGKPIMLANRPPANSQRLWVTGWGSLYTNGPVVQFLRGTIVDVLSSEICKNSYGKWITPRMMCAAAPAKDACQGDSGGPLFSNRLYGVVSWGADCASPRYPGIYTNVANPSIRDYIRRVANV